MGMSCRREGSECSARLPFRNTVTIFELLDVMPIPRPPVEGFPSRYDALPNVGEA